MIFQIIKTPRDLILDSDYQVNTWAVSQTKFIMEMIELVLLAASNTEMKKIHFFEFL